MFKPLWVLLASAALATQAAAPQVQPTVQQRDLVLERLKSKPAPVEAPHGYAVVIGIGDFKNLDAAHRLQFAESDASAMYRVLISQEGGNFPAENVHVLKGPEATAANIRRELEDWLPAHAQPADRVVVYVASHGIVTAKGLGYLAAWDVDRDRIEETAYPMAALGDVLANRVKARWKVLLVDACHSGKINPASTDAAVDAQVRSLARSFLTLTATRERESSYEDPNLSAGFGLFTYFVVEGLKGNADTPPCDRKITANELIEYVRSNVSRYAKRIGRSQNPTERGDFDGEMLLGVSTTCPEANAAAPSMVGRALVQTNRDDVEVYVDGDRKGTVSKGKTFVVEGLSSTLHEFKGVKAGYEADRQDILIRPGEDTPVMLTIKYQRQIKPSALDRNAEGEKLLLTQRSAWNPVNIAPVRRSQSHGDLIKARDLFSRALTEDPTFSRAAFNLGQVNQLLGDEAGSVKAYRRALDIDPAYVQARNQYAAVLLESGDADEAIRQLTEAQRLEPGSDEICSLLARAYLDKESWEKSLALAEEAIRLNSSNAQAHFYRADSRRQIAATSVTPEQRLALYTEAREDYRTFINLTNYSTSPYEWLVFHFIGFHLGGRRHPDRQVAYDSLRAAGYRGLCLSEQKVGNPLRAKGYCERALQYEPKNAITYFLLGNLHRDLFNRDETCGELTAASTYYTKMLEINPDLEESRHATYYLEQIAGIRRAGQCNAV